MGSSWYLSWWTMSRSFSRSTVTGPSEMRLARNMTMLRRRSDITVHEASSGTNVRKLERQAYSAITFNELQRMNMGRRPSHGIPKRRGMEERPRTASLMEFSHGSAMSSAQKTKAINSGEYLLIQGDDRRNQTFSKNERNAIEYSKAEKLLTLDHRLRMKNIDKELGQLSAKLQELETAHFEESKGVRAVRRHFSNQRKIQEERFAKFKSAQLRRDSIIMQKEFDSQSQIRAVERKAFGRRVQSARMPASYEPLKFSSTHLIRRVTTL